MPNWIVGTFRARGSKDNIKSFIFEGLKPISYWGKEERTKKELDDYDDNFIVTFKRIDNEDKEVKLLYISDTNRSFINSDDGIYAYKNKKGEFCFASSFKSAWAIDTDKIIEVAKKFNIDIRINGYERGMEFEQLFEVSRNGEVKCDSFIQYEDYTWECAMPLLGG